MSKARRLQALLAALCLSAVMADSALAQDAAPAAQPQTAPAATPDAYDGSRPGWLMRSPPRTANPFRTTPAPGTTLSQQPRQNFRVGPNLNGPSQTRIPANAMADPAQEQGWSCNRGFQQKEQSCAPVRVPANAMLDFSGHGWMCNQGFVRRNERCFPFRVPENATADALGTHWTCNPGFLRRGASCLAIEVPEHASLDANGRMWVCDAGYQRQNNRCVDEATARLQKQADKAVNSVASGKTAPPRSITVRSGENRKGRDSKATVVIGRF